MKRSVFIPEGVSGEDAQKIRKELELGYLNLSDGMFEQADLNFSLVLQWEKTCAEAFWGKVLTKFQIKREDELFSNALEYKNVVFLPEYEKAFQFASDEQRNVYKGLMQRIYEINQGDQY